MQTHDLPHLVCLHFLGGSARSWEKVTSRLSGVAQCVPLDLPGFGAAADAAGYTVAEMADGVVLAIQTMAPRRWCLAGHSMGAKVAAVVARRAEDGEAGLENLAGLILIAGSPPSPEPMEEEKRQTMLGWFAGDGMQSRAEAETYIRSAVANPLCEDWHNEAVDTVLQANPAAWQAWLRSGSREDWSGRVGMLDVPTLIVAGDSDAELGVDAQAALRDGHFHHARLVTLPGAHLLPMEAPDALARLIAAHVRTGVDPAYHDLIMSNRVSRNTRDLLLARATPDDPGYRPRVLEDTGLAVLRAMLARVLPQTHELAIDLAARIDAQLAGDEGDGWRFAALPPDVLAYRAGLQTLDAASGQGFCSLDADRQDALLQRAAAGQIGLPGDGLLDESQMKLWFEDVCADATRLYVAHPATLGWMGYSGIGYGGDGEPKHGFHRVGVGEREDWEPQAIAS